jgi:hypothetical protein
MDHNTTRRMMIKLMMYHAPYACALPLVSMPCCPALRAHLRVSAPLMRVHGRAVRRCKSLCGNVLWHAATMHRQAMGPPLVAGFGLAPPGPAATATTVYIPLPEYPFFGW